MYNPDKIIGETTVLAWDLLSPLSKKIIIGDALIFTQMWVLEHDIAKALIDAPSIESQLVYCDKAFMLQESGLIYSSKMVLELSTQMSKWSIGALKFYLMRHMLEFTFQASQSAA